MKNYLLIALLALTGCGTRSMNLDGTEWVCQNKKGILLTFSDKDAVLHGGTAEASIALGMFSGPYHLAKNKKRVFIRPLMFSGPGGVGFDEVAVLEGDKLSLDLLGQKTLIFKRSEL